MLPDMDKVSEALEALHLKAKEKYKKIKESAGLLDKVRKQMDSLAAKADLVSPDDVMDSAAKLVSEGLGASAMAGVLASAPPKPEALAAWVAQHDADVRKREEQVKLALEAARHEMAVTGLQLLGAQHLGPTTGLAPKGPPPGMVPPGLGGMASPAEGGAAAPPLGMMH